MRGMIRTISIVAGFTALLLCGLAHAAEPVEPRRVALVIGNSAYPVRPLPNARNDARLVARTLVAAGFELIGGHEWFDLSGDGLRDAAKLFGRSLGPNTVAVLYFAGHGIEDNGKNYLVPVDADITASLQLYDLLPVDQLMTDVERARTGMGIIILDACRTYPVAGLRGAGAGLAQMQAPRGTLVAFATQPGRAAQDGSSGNSPYALALADAIRKPGLDVFNTFNDVARQVDDATQHEQTPWFSSSPISAQFYFTPGPSQEPASRGPVTASLPAPSSAPERNAAPAPIAPAPDVKPGQETPSSPAPPIASLPRANEAPQAAPRSPPVTDLRELGRQLQAELRRTGCYRGAANGVWGPSSISALELFNRRARTGLDAQHPSAEAVAVVSRQSGTVCQPVVARAQPGPSNPSGVFEQQRPPAITSRQAPNCIRSGGAEYCE
jgi:hypothetical protein